MAHTTDRNHPGLTHGIDTERVPQADVYLVLGEEERAKGFVRPYRDSYLHLACGSLTVMSRPLSETYARDPKFYGATYCVACAKHLPVDQFVWAKDNEQVGS